MPVKRESFLITRFALKCLACENALTIIVSDSKATGAMLSVAAGKGWIVVGLVCFCPDCRSKVDKYTERAIKSRERYHRSKTLLPKENAR